MWGCGSTKGIGRGNSGKIFNPFWILGPITPIFEFLDYTVCWPRDLATFPFAARFKARVIGFLSPFLLRFWWFHPEFGF